MSTLTPKDRVSLCTFTFSDGRRCLSPRTPNHPRFCPDHAQKAARARATKKLSKDLTYFFSADYLSACDLSTALATLIPAVVRGDLKPRTAHTVAYLAQTLMQAIHMSKHEYCEAFSSDAWRKSIRNSVNHNQNYRVPPAPVPEPPPHQAPPVVAGLQTGEGRAPQPSPAPAPQQAASPEPHQPASQPVEPPENCHSACPDLVGERSEESASSSNSSLATRHSSLPQPLPPTSAEFVQKVVAGHSERSDERPTSGASPDSGQEDSPPSSGSPPVYPDRVGVTPHSPFPQSPSPAPRSDNPPETRPAAQPNSPPPALPSTPKTAGPNRDAPWLNWEPTRHLPPDSHLL